MRTITTVSEMRRWADVARCEARIIGLVPTMGALHDGHASLMRAARAQCDRVVVSVFVNPTQFGPHEDFERYPRMLDADRARCEREQVDLLFMPTVEDMYPPGAGTVVDVGSLGAVLCGASRPDHFRGVATVVTKLLAVVTPHRAYFGQKDYQQTRVVRRLVDDLRLGVTIVVCPTEREPDGLAMSSRNAYLSSDQRRQAAGLARALAEAKRLVTIGERSAGKIRRALEVILTRDGPARIDYIAIVHPETLQPMDPLTNRVVVALAIWIGNTRLIDNELIEVGNG